MRSGAFAPAALAALAGLACGSAPELYVPMQTVTEDFLLTNHYTAEKIERTLLVIRFASFFRVDPERVRPVLGVEPAYLDAAFDEIEVRYGSFDRYRREALGLDDARLAAFRDLALE